MRNEIFLPDDLQNVVDRKAAKIGLSTAAYITDFLMNAFKDELNAVPSKSYSQLYSELREAVIDYKNNKLKSGDKFTLKDVPYYRDLSIVNADGTHIVPSGIRARLGRSINSDIRFNGSPDFADVKRALTKNGKPAFMKKDNSNAAIYEKL